MPRKKASSSKPSSTKAVSKPAAQESEDSDGPPALISDDSDGDDLPPKSTPLPPPSPPSKATKPLQNAISNKASSSSKAVSKPVVLESDDSDDDVPSLPSKNDYRQDKSLPYLPPKPISLPPSQSNDGKLKTSSVSETKALAQTLSAKEIIAVARKVFDASKAGNLNEVLKLLLPFRDHPQLFTVVNWYNREESEKTALWVAVKRKHIDIVRELLKLGADPNVKDNYGDTVMSVAKDPAIIKELELHMNQGKKLESKIVISPEKQREKAVKIQSRFRMWLSYRKFAPAVKEKCNALLAFKKKWSIVLSALRSGSELKLFSWSKVKIESEFSCYDERNERMEERVFQSITASVLDQSSVSGSTATGFESDAGTSELAEGEGEEFELPFEVWEVSAQQPQRGDNVLPSESAVSIIEMTRSVTRWMDRADQKYRKMFARRVYQLSQGYRSYALSKPLKRFADSEIPIYETKLDAGMRILWTKVFREDMQQPSILLWFVSKHDDVPHFIDNIDRAYQRMAKQPRACLKYDPMKGEAAKVGSMDEVLDSFVSLSEDTVLLDPLGNAPLKIYTAYAAELKHISEPENAWKPRLRLTKREREVNELTGTVLLLGRSGTGKTVCLSDRMIKDKEFAALRGSKPLAQLFVSRSQRLCQFVQIYQEFLRGKEKFNAESASDAASAPAGFGAGGAVGGAVGGAAVGAAVGAGAGACPSYADYLSMDKFIARIESAVSRAKGPSARVYSLESLVTFSTFRELIYPAISESAVSRLSRAASKERTKDSASQRRMVDAAVVWTQIRSFIKGSIEAVYIHKAALPLDEYLSFSPSRCKLSEAQREDVYAIYLQYESHLRAFDLWDECDRVMDLLCNRLQWEVGEVNYVQRAGCGRFYDKIYVDEVQDNTQAEIALFFMASGKDYQSLFMAGDPAQAVVEGVDFRFEEVRGVVYTMSHKEQSIGKVTKLETNFRSHTGILNVAAAILSKLFGAFAGSSAMLSKDAGLFQGPRPCLCEAFDRASGNADLVRLLAHNDRLIVLTPDENKLGLAEATGREDAVLGIREAKGLEFPDVLIVDFFRRLPREDQKAWKQLLLPVSVSAAESFSAPAQLEVQMKVLYTAVTRCCDRLIFLETEESEAGKAFYRWLQKESLADLFSLQKMLPSEREGFDEIDDASSASRASAAPTDQLLSPPPQQQQPNKQGNVIKRRVMTKDEWRQRGLEFASLVDPSDWSAESLSMLRRSKECFVRAEAIEFTKQATLQIEALELYSRLLLQAPAAGVNSASDDRALVPAIGRCLELGLLNCAELLCSISVSRTNASDEKRFIRRDIGSKLSHILSR